jgi:hypothetical protein
VCRFQRTHLNSVIFAVCANCDDEIHEVHLCNLLQAEFTHVPFVNEIVEICVLRGFTISAHIRELHEVIGVNADNGLHQPRRALHSSGLLGSEHSVEPSQVRYLSRLALALHSLRTSNSA